ncbi:MAG TPA: site-2 protease family protein [Pirellulales bacterium]|nr:site-2 protease family protein [Pirellulales bacterium]
MRDLLSWNVPLGRWAGVQVRLHVLFLLFALFALNFSWREDLIAYGGICLAVLFASALLHELGHCIAARKIGGTADQVLLWPLGGLSHINVSQDPQIELITALAGPMINLFIGVAMAPAVMLLKGPESLAAALNPLVPPVPAGAAALTVGDVAECTLWINWILALANALPAFPLDGGRALRAVLWPRYGYRTAVLLVVRAAKLTALALCIVAWLVRAEYDFAPLPLILLAVFLYFAAKQEAERLQDSDPGDGSFGYDFSQGYTSLERQFQPPQREPGFIRRWLEQRREQRAMRRQLIEQEEERRVDEVLARLHLHGRDGLSPEDRSLLDRVSARYRNRMRG